MADNSPRIVDWKIAGYGNRVTADEWTTVRDAEGKKVGPEPRESTLGRSKEVVIIITDSNGDKHFMTIVSMRGFLPHPQVIEGQIYDAVDPEYGSPPVKGLIYGELV